MVNERLRGFAASHQAVSELERQTDTRQAVERVLAIRHLGSNDGVRWRQRIRRRLMVASDDDLHSGVIRQLHLVYRGNPAIDRDDEIAPILFEILHCFLGSDRSPR